MSIKAWLILRLINGELPSWSNRLLGKRIMIDLEKKMEDIQVKSKWKSKTVWVAIIGVVLGAIEPISKALGNPIIVPSWILEVLAGMGLYSLRVGDKTLI